VRKNIKEAIRTFISFEVERNRGPLILTVLIPYFIIYNIVLLGFPSILLILLVHFISPATNVGKLIFIFGLIANLIGLAVLVLFVAKGLIPRPLGRS
jgi:hypothetical protein